VRTVVESLHNDEPVAGVSVNGAVELEVDEDAWRLLFALLLPVPEWGLVEEKSVVEQCWKCCESMQTCALG